MSSTSENKTILVTYHDRIITRAPIATLAGSYRRSTSYSSSTWSRNIAEQLAEQYQLKILIEWPISELGVQCVVFEIQNNRSIEDVIALIDKNTLVDSVQPMGTFNLHTAETTSVQNDRLHASPYTLNLVDVHRDSTGRGVVIALIDTGVDIEHPDLKGQFEVIDNLVSDTSSEFASDLHGTAVAGIIAARANNIGAVGIAPDVQIVALKACWPLKQGGLKASCNSLSLSMAINRAIILGVDIINLSLSGDGDPLVMRLINVAISQGIVVVAADHGSGQTGVKSFPASMDGVIAARHLQTTVDASRVYSQRSIAVQSTDLLTTLPGGRYDLVSGCSIATAQVSGIVALLLEINPDLTPHQVQTMLETAHQRKNVLGINEIDVHALVSRLRSERTKGS
jgi:subtilisin family serine protease